MKIEWTLHNISDLYFWHLKANLEYWKMDMLYNADRYVNRIDRSRTIKLVSKNKQANMLIEFARNRGKLAQEDIDSMVNYRLKRDGNNVILELFVNDVYFSTIDSLDKGRIGRALSKHLNIPSRQNIIDTFEDEFTKMYTKDFHGKIIEDDGKELNIAK